MGPRLQENREAGPTVLTAFCFPLLTWVVVICWDGTASRCVFVPVLGETAAQRKKISARRGSLALSRPLGALSEVSRQDKRRQRGCSSAQDSLFSRPSLPIFQHCLPAPAPLHRKRRNHWMENISLSRYQVWERGMQALATTQWGLDKGRKNINVADGRLSPVSLAILSSVHGLDSCS